MGRVLALHIAMKVQFPAPHMASEHRARSKPSKSLAVAPKQKSRKGRKNLARLRKKTLGT